MPDDLAALAIKAAVDIIAERNARIASLEATLAARTEEIRRYVQAKIGEES